MESNASFASRVARTIQRLVAQHWQRLLAWRGQWRPSEETFHLLLAVLVGIGAGLVNWGFYLSVESAQRLLLGRQGDLVEVAEVMPPWARVIATTLGGLLAGGVLHWGLRWAGKPGPTNLVEVVVAGDGRLPFRTMLVKTLSSLLSLGSGASIGREGSIIQVTATLASKAGVVSHYPPYRLRLLIACGAAAGMAAAYNAPIAGAVFAAQIVLGNFSMNLFAPLLCASVTAAVVSRSFFGIDPWYKVPGFDFTRLMDLPWFPVLGIVSGIVGAVFLKLLERCEKAFRESSIPIYARLTVAGFGVGTLAYFMPEVWGNGYRIATRILQDQYEFSFLALILLTKLVAVCVTVGAGTVGGVFTPTLFLGCAVGSLFGHVLHLAGIALDLPTGAFALVGMGSVLAATVHSPLLAIITLFEISLSHSLIPPLMLACAVSTLVAKRLHPSSIYTEPLRLRGLDTGQETEQEGIATQQTVGDIMEAPVEPMRETASFREIADRFLRSTNNFLPVVDDTHRLLGVVALQDLKEYLNSGHQLQGVIAFDIMRPPPLCLTPNQRLQEALPTLLASELRHVPVVNNYRELRLIGTVVQADALGILSEAIASASTSRR
jgi:CIC family chloride channel protein